MKFEKVAAKRSWKAPQLERLALDDERVRQATAENPLFREAAERRAVKA